MEEDEKEVINRNLIELIGITVINSKLLAILYTSGILSDEDLERMELKASNRIDRALALEFYKLIMTRENAFKVLLKALKQTRQTGAIRILKNTRTSENSCEEDDNVRLRSHIVAGETQEPNKPTIISCFKNSFQRNIRVFILIPVVLSFVLLGSALIIYKHYDQNDPSDRANVKSIKAPENTSTGLVTESDTHIKSTNNVSTFSLQSTTHTNKLVSKQTTTTTSSSSGLSPLPINTNSVRRCKSTPSGYALGCPDSEGCPCWADAAKRDSFCAQKNYPRRWETYGNFGFMTCYCCGV